MGYLNLQFMHIGYGFESLGFKENKMCIVNFEWVELNELIALIEQ